MANDANGLFHWYRRYKVRAQDMNDFQDAMTQVGRGLGEGILGAAVLRGGSVAPGGGLTVSVSPTVANGATGYLNVINDTVVLDVSTGAASGLPTRSLIVIQPYVTDSVFIPSPTTPFTMVPLKQLQKSRIAIIPGTPSTLPNYPAKGANDVILCGIKIPAGASVVTTTMLDFEVRDSIGLNSLIAQNQVRFDNRLRSYRASNTTLSIKPSQNVGSEPFGFSYPGRLTPSLFPLQGGVFVPLDTLVDFSAGTISGGDATTPAFSPQIPPGGNSQVCVVTLAQNDTLRFNFGDYTGTYDQVLNAIHNQIFSGPGSLPAPDGNFGIAFVVLTSIGGTLSDIQVFDGRPFLGSGSAAAKFKNETPAGAINGSNPVFTLSSTPSDPGSLSFLVDGNKLTTAQYTLNGNLVTITDPSFFPVPGQTVYASYLIYGAVSNTPSSGIPAARFRQETPSGVIDGTNAVFSLSSVPVDPDSLDFYVDENKLMTTDYTLSGATVTITNPVFIPVLGQTTYSKYLYQGVILGGAGGGGGTSGYAPMGSRISPVLIPGVSGLVPSTNPLQIWFVKSPTGPQIVTSVPQIRPGVLVGQQLKIKIADDTNFPIFNDGNGLDLNGAWPATGSSVLGASIDLSWDGTYWSENSRR